MRKFAQYILICAISLLAFAGCDVHEFPDPQLEVKVPFELHLNFDNEMTLHDVITHTRSGEEETKAPFSSHDFRYVIKAYRLDRWKKNGDNEADAEFVFTRPSNEELNYTAELPLHEGDYRFLVWCDYVDAGTNADKYYTTSDFKMIAMTELNEYEGSNDFRDAFRGMVDGSVRNPDLYAGDIVDTFTNEATAQMTRPVGKLKFISTDVDIFVDHITDIMKEQGLLMSNFNDLTFEQMLQSIRIEDFKVVVRYSHYLPCAYNMYEDRASDSRPASFTSTLQREGDRNMLLGYDYVISEKNKGVLITGINIEVYNKDGELMSKTDGIPGLRIMQSQMTVVQGEFLTSKASGGVSINPGYDGPDFNIPLSVRTTKNIFE